MNKEERDAIYNALMFLAGAIEDGNISGVREKVNYFIWFLLQDKTM